ncbi:hypothetical protein WKW79_34810 [Variovorax robiniae]|uniref:Uncharacterized protein n=1 Tax=Variovorax robiniae TaxID=1836199 RepID=A0ABU8XIR7_9BURK
MYRIGAGLVEVKLEDLRPTQMTVGFREGRKARFVGKAQACQAPGGDAQ